MSRILSYTGLSTIVCLLGFYGCIARPLSNRGVGLDLTPSKTNRVLYNNAPNIYLMVRQPAARPKPSSTNGDYVVSRGKKIFYTVGAKNCQGQQLLLCWVNKDTNEIIDTLLEKRLPADKAFWGQEGSFVVQKASPGECILRLAVGTRKEDISFLVTN